MTCAASRMCRSALLALAIGLSSSPPRLVAQEATARGDSVRALYQIALPAGFAERSAFVRSFPATSAATPSAFGPQWGDVFMGGGYQQHTRASRVNGTQGAHDGAVVAGFGIGSARMLGLEVALTSFRTFRSGFLTRTGVSFKAHHLFSNGVAIAAGSETAIVPGEAGDGSRAHYVVLSRVYHRSSDTRRPFSAIGLSLGAGDGRFRTLSDLRADRKHIGVFGAVSARLTDAVGAVADWTGQDLTLSASLVPLRCLPITITPGVTDVLRHAGTRPRFLMSVGVGLRPDQLSARVRDCF